MTAVLRTLESDGSAYPDCIMPRGSARVIPALPDTSCKPAGSDNVGALLHDYLADVARVGDECFFCAMGALARERLG